MKKFYFVRHGESKGNAGKTYQGPSSGLSELGLKQAEIIAERCSKLAVKAMISSTLCRAQETAHIVSDKIKLPFVSSDLFIENTRPNEQYGLVRDSDEAKKIDQVVIENFALSGHRYSDEENFEDLCLRAEKALEFLGKQAEGEVLVITHGLFLRILIGKAIFGSNFTVEICKDLLKNLRTNNTGISVMELDEDNNQWLLRTFNDHAHLG